MQNQLQPKPSQHLTIELEQEDDGRWIAEIPEISGVLVYGQNQQDAIAAVQALALRVIADKLEHGEMTWELNSLTFVTP
ncbi:MAG: type II toxin-antitoxin system HicB family antitoxin [Kamptonema sp. SIO4C4]|nr:type II toxin-antitoxin system HicB family antitoxin [Kamptonema sp. SIO4C4]